MTLTERLLALNENDEYYRIAKDYNLFMLIDSKANAFVYSLKEMRPATQFFYLGPAESRQMFNTFLGFKSTCWTNQELERVYRLFQDLIDKKGDSIRFVLDDYWRVRLADWTTLTDAVTVLETLLVWKLNSFSKKVEVVSKAAKKITAGLKSGLDSDQIRVLLSHLEFVPAPSGKSLGFRYSTELLQPNGYGSASFVFYPGKSENTVSEIWVSDGWIAPSSWWLGDVPASTIRKAFKAFTGYDNIELRNDVALEVQSRFGSHKVLIQGLDYTAKISLGKELTYEEATQVLLALRKISLRGAADLLNPK